MDMVFSIKGGSEMVLLGVGGKNCSLHCMLCTLMLYCRRQVQTVEGDGVKRS